MQSVKIKGYKGKWSEIDHTIRNGVRYLLLENDFYGDATCGLIVDDELNVIDETWDDIETALDDLLDE